MFAWVVRSEYFENGMVVFETIQIRTDQKACYEKETRLVRSVLCHDFFDTEKEASDYLMEEAR